jgi:signal transduction histidine kinase
LNEKPHFDISAFVIKQLGEELISDEVTALIELVKNSYDADASYVNVVISTDGNLDDLQSPMSKDKRSSPGYILIEDNGTGMTSKEIHEGWLTISFSKKREMKRQEKVSPKKGRIPLGEKGLGRLSTQRLGSRLEMITTKDPKFTEKTGKSIQYHVGFDWNDFVENRLLTAVPIYFQEQAVDKAKPGTRLIITDLKDRNVWVDKQDDLIRQLSQLIFPFEEVRGFNVYLTINGVRIDLGSISSNLREISLSNYRFSFDDNSAQQLKIIGRVKLSRLKGMGQEREEAYNSLLLKDQGKEFFAYLKNPENKFRILDVNLSKERGWFITFERTFDRKGNELEKDGSYANPGRFHGEIDEFALRGVNTEPLEDIYSKVADYRDYVSRNAGIRVYRDGFGIRPYGLDGNDWLYLSAAQTSGRSFLGMRPQNVIGYVALTAKENSQLQEKTDREGFVKNPYQENFMALMFFVRDEINRFLNNLRRSYVDFKKSDADKRANLFTGNALDAMHDISASSQSVEKKVQRLDQGLTNLVGSVKGIATKVKDTPLLATEEERRLNPILIETGEKLEEARSLIEELQNLLTKLNQFGAKADSIQSDIEILEDQLAQFSELAGLGLTAEALSHEIHNIADRLAEQTKVINEKLRKKDIVDAQLVTYLEYVHSAIAGLRKQLSHLAPSLRYVREKKEVISIRQFFVEQKDFYETGRFQQTETKVILDKPFDNFKILINKGKLTQIIDNIFLNSEYWLKEAIRQKQITSPCITIKSDYPLIAIFDNGIGVEPAIEMSLFQPFVTTKPKNVGRGLGLFIVQELLDSSGCGISLLPDRNKFGRRYVFQIDFSGALNE